MLHLQCTLIASAIAMVSAAHQQWDLIYVGNHPDYETDHCLEYNRQKTAVTLQPCDYHLGSGQRFAFDGRDYWAEPFSIRIGSFYTQSTKPYESYQTNLCLDVGGVDTDSDFLMIQECNGLPQQQFSVDAEAGLVFPNGKCLDGGNASTAGNIPQISPCNGEPQQSWGKCHMVGSGGGIVHGCGPHMGSTVDKDVILSKGLDGAEAPGPIPAPSPSPETRVSTSATADVQMANSTLQSSSQCGGKGSPLGSARPTPERRERCCSGCFGTTPGGHGFQYHCEPRDPQLLYQGSICCSDDCCDPWLHGAAVV